jgi:hypothetical protein
MSRAAPVEPQIAAWPALLTTELACAYTCLSEMSFRLLARKGSVEPVECGGLAVTRWRRTDLDRLIDSLPARGAEIQPQEASDGAPARVVADPAEEALRRAARRARGGR